MPGHYAEEDVVAPANLESFFSGGMDELLDTSNKGMRQDVPSVVSDQSDQSNGMFGGVFDPVEDLFQRFFPSNPKDLSSVDVASMIGGIGGLGFRAAPYIGKFLYDSARKEGKPALSGKASDPDNYLGILQQANKEFANSTNSPFSPHAREVARARGSDDVTLNDYINAIGDMVNETPGAGFPEQQPSGISGGEGDNSLFGSQGMGGANFRGGTTADRSLSDARAQINLDQQSLEEALIPLFLEEQGYKLTFDNEGNVTGADIIEGGAADLSGQNRRTLLEHQQKALAGELPIPGLEAELARRESALRETLRRQIPQGGFETSSGTAERLEYFLGQSEIAKDAARRGQLTDISNLSTQAGGGAARDVQSTVATYQSPLARQQVSLQERQLDAYIQELALKRESQQPDYWGTALASIGQGAGQMAGYGFSKMLFS